VVVVVEVVVVVMVVVVVVVVVVFNSCSGVLWWVNAVRHCLHGCIISLFSGFA
jgi:hypothetical protein